MVSVSACDVQTVCGQCYLELGTDAGGLLLLVQVQQRLGSAIVQRQAHDELQRARVQQILHNSQTGNQFPTCTHTSNCIFSLSAPKLGVFTRVYLGDDLPLPGGLLFPVKDGETRSRVI